MVLGVGCWVLIVWFLLFRVEWLNPERETTGYEPLIPCPARKTRVGVRWWAGHEKERERERNERVDDRRDFRALPSKEGTT